MAPSGPPPTIIGLDADDTLWENEQFFQMTEARFRGLLADYADPVGLSDRLLEAETRNIGHYGFGVKGFTLSMIETAIEVTDGRVPAHVISNILEAGRDLLSHPIEPRPHAHETVQLLSENHRLVLITKGDLFDQERKLAQSELGDFFDAIEIVSDKTTNTYRTIFNRHGDGAEHRMMVGNSIRSDVLPALEAGAWGVHVPYGLTWAYEYAEPPKAHPRFRRIDHLGEISALLAALDELS